MPWSLLSILLIIYLFSGLAFLFQAKRFEVDACKCTCHEIHTHTHTARNAGCFQQDDPPFDSQSAQNLFSSNASRELSTDWYLSKSFTDLPVIIAQELPSLWPTALQLRRPWILNSPPWFDSWKRRVAHWRFWMGWGGRWGWRVVGTALKAKSMRLS